MLRSGGTNATADARYRDQGANDCGGVSVANPWENNANIRLENFLTDHSFMKKSLMQDFSAHLGSSDPIDAAITIKKLPESLMTVAISLRFKLWFESMRAQIREGHPSGERNAS